MRGDKFARAEEILTVEKCGISPVTYTYVNTLLSPNLKGVYINGAGGPALEFRDAYVE